MKPTPPSDPTLEHLRAQFAAGNVEGARRALMQLSPQGRAELEARLGAPAVARMMRISRRSRGRMNGRVVVLHGIMGGKLATIEASGDEDLVWLNVLRWRWAYIRLRARCECDRSGLPSRGDAWVPTNTWLGRARAALGSVAGCMIASQRPSARLE